MVAKTTPTRAGAPARAPVRRPPASAAAKAPRVAKAAAAASRTKARKPAGAVAPAADVGVKGKARKAAGAAPAVAAPDLRAVAQVPSRSRKAAVASLTLLPELEALLRPLSPEQQRTVAGWVLNANQDVVFSTCGRIDAVEGVTEKIKVILGICERGDAVEQQTALRELHKVQFGFTFDERERGLLEKLLANPVTRRHTALYASFQYRAIDSKDYFGALQEAIREGDDREKSVASSRLVEAATSEDVRWSKSWIDGGLLASPPEAARERLEQLASLLRQSDEILQVVEENANRKGEAVHKAMLRVHELALNEETVVARLESLLESHPLNYHYIAFKLARFGSEKAVDGLAKVLKNPESVLGDQTAAVKWLRSLSGRFASVKQKIPEIVAGCIVRRRDVVKNDAFEVALIGVLGGSLLAGITLVYMYLSRIAFSSGALASLAGGALVGLMGGVIIRAFKTPDWRIPSSEPIVKGMELLVELRGKDALATLRLVADKDFRKEVKEAAKKHVAELSAKA